MALRIALAIGDPAVERVVAAGLAYRGIQVRSLGSGRELVNWCRSARPDVAVCDSRLPDMDSLEAAAALRAERLVPVVLLSGGWTAARAIRAEDLGAVCLNHPVTLSDLADTAAQLAAPRPAQLPAPAEFPVLVVDTNADAAVTLADVLRLRKVGVRTAVTPDAARAALTDAPPEVVILEPRLRGLDGWELARQFRHRAEDRRQLRVAVTTGGRFDDRRRSAEAGLALHLVKPADPKLVTDVVTGFLRAGG
jgi:two-component system, OmpR family, response regulator